MECPKCGATNPEGAEHCNLCLRSFVERAPAERPEPVVSSTDTDDVRKRLRLPDVHLSPATALAWHGGLTAVSAGLLFLFSLGVFQLVGLPVLKFLFLGVTLNKPALSFFLLVTGLFTLVSGAVAGNLLGKKNLVPVVRLLGGMIGAGVWVGLVFAVKPAAQSFAGWLAGSLVGMAVGVSAFPITALCLSLTESFGEEWDPARAVRSAIGGLAAGSITALAAILAFIAIPLFGEDMPVGFLLVSWFSVKVALCAVAIGFTSGFAFWLALAKAQEQKP
jgi:hypothetical protein